MEKSSYHTILENLKNNGQLEIDRLIALGEQESFYIDYKEVSTTFPATRLSDNDRKNYAKAISGFSNTSGGVLVWGIAENNNTFSKKEIDNPDEFVRLLNTEVSTLTLPTRTNVHSFAIKLASGKGYVVTEIPKYYFSPVQVITKNIKDIAFKYYMRSGSSFEPANHDLLSGLYNRQQSSRIISGWAHDVEGSSAENDQIINFRVKFWIQNKGLGVLKDVWINFTSSGLKVGIESTPQTQIFTGWNVHGDALNLITKDDYKFGPQHFIYPFLIDLTILKNSIPDKAFVYISFGADGAMPVELDLEVTKAKIESFLQQADRKTPDFLKYFEWHKK